jgi:hypothetical protein
VSGIPEIVCQGAPRDLGLDQGAACAAAIRDRVARAGGRGDWLGRWRPFARGGLARARATGRDVRRHFPHLDERVIGLARGARVPELALHYLLARELAGEGTGAGLRVDLDPEGRVGVAGAEDGILRRAAPDAGFASLEWTLPWLPGALAGVNRAGLAGAAGAFTGADGAACAAPAFLLLQNCLAQFETVENAVEWCERRPGGGRATLAFADATGARAVVVIDGDKRFRGELPAPPDPHARRLVLDPAARTLRIGDEPPLEA